MTKTTAQALIICGPSGVGKGTLISLLVKRHPHKLSLCVSHTTRKSRHNETHATHYHFIEKDLFQSMIANKEFIEHAKVHGNYYGTSTQEIQRIQKLNLIPLLDLDLKGVSQIREKKFNCKIVGIVPPSMSLLEERLKTRGTENQHEIETRLKNASEEIQKIESGSFCDLIIRNEDSFKQGIVELNDFVTKHFNL